jgi:hypothetical protein
MSWAFSASYIAAWTWKYGGAADLAEIIERDRTLPSLNCNITRRGHRMVIDAEAFHKAVDQIRDGKR